MVPGKRRRGRNSRPYTHSIRKSLLIRDIQCFSISPLFIVVFSFFFFLHLQRVSPFSFSLRVRLSFLFLVPSYRILLLCRYYRIAGESQARSDLRGFSSSTYLSVSSPTTFFLLFSLLPRGGRRFCQRTPSFSIDRLPTGHRWCVSFFFFFYCFFDSKGIPLCWQWGARDASIDLLEIALLFELCFAVSRKPSISNTQGTLLFSFADDRRTSLFFNPLVLCFF